LSSEGGGQFISSDEAKKAIDSAAYTQDSAVAKSMFMDGETVMSTSLDPNDNSDVIRVYGWGPLAEPENRKMSLPGAEYRWQDPKVDGYWSIRESNMIYSPQASWDNLGAQEVALHDPGRTAGLTATIDPSQVMYPAGSNMRTIYGAQILDGAGIDLIGDFDGDGRSDIFGITGEDYILTSFSRGDGEFYSVFFTPWYGYGTLLGAWVVSDVNGDGKDDLQHIWGGDYINTWISRGDGTYQIKSFQPWPGYNTSMGSWTQGDVNGDGKGDLQHLVGGEYINTWISKGDGTYLIKSFRPKPGYDTSLGLWTQGDVNGDGKGDLQHIWGGDFINTWISNGDGTYWIKSFRPWPGYDTAFGEFHVADYNGDGMDDILHLFGGYYPYYYLWTSNGDGTYYL
jgi:hypothetical protein